MKIRTCYVSNSSSSSFIIAYDKSFWGDLSVFFRKNELGCETSVCNDEKDFIEHSYSGKIDKDKYDEKLKEAKEKGLNDIIYLFLDEQYIDVLKFMKQVNDNNESNKMMIVFGE